MPVYLCKPGCYTSEPWRHGIQVYAYPFDMDAQEKKVPQHRQQRQREFTEQTDDVGASYSSLGDSQHREEPPRTQVPAPSSGMQIRRVRHAEVVLVDDVCLAFSRYWLRLRWPGKGGFAGYIALGKAQGALPEPLHENLERRFEGTMTNVTTIENMSAGSPQGPVTRLESELSGLSGGQSPATELPQHNTETQEHDGYFAPTGDDPSPPAALEHDNIASLQCLRTGLYFPSSSGLRLLARYDDGLSPPVTSARQNDTEPVMCRICREGLHDDEEQAPEEGAQEDDVVEVEPPSLSSKPTTTTGPLQPHPAYHSNPYAAENPLLAPCECSGSMAFVHYLCIEQWRCRSRHPEARNGLNCETCSAPYALPPPASRPEPHHQQHVMAEDDWLEAMPAHVMAALRQPHLVWQLGAAVTRRRWLRPFAPILISPLVALYCRARRLLKKRGVSRRRWACSLCRRRARWKCVRCLRSYYCSRQCQNVSWHIVHKHVCYKPSRFWWSVVAYSLLFIYLFPGALRDPLVYDLGIAFLPVSFYVMGVLGGGVATLMKKCGGMDLRGRMLELTVVLMTVGLFHVTWGVVWAFFGDPSMCMGLLGTSDVESEPARLVRVLQKGVFRPAEVWFLFWDRVGLRAPLTVRSTLCPAVKDTIELDSNSTCFVHTPSVDFFLDEPKCASDLEAIGSIWALACVVLAASTLWKKHERRQRARARAMRRRVHGDEVHLHED